MATDIRNIASAIVPRAGRAQPSAASVQATGVRPKTNESRTDEMDRDRAARARPEPQSLADLSKQAFGSVQLPSRLELVAALEAARDFAPLADRAVPGLGRLVAAVIDDESRKLTRSLDMAGQ